MADKDLRVRPEHLLESGTQVAGHAEDVHTAHSAADGRIASAIEGWTGMSQAAMTAKAAQWEAATTALAFQLYDHAQNLHSGAHAYQHTEHTSATALGEGLAAPELL